MTTSASLIRSIRIWLAVFMVGLILSGLTAFPLTRETAILVQAARALALDSSLPELFAWLTRVHDALAATDRSYPFLAYGTDWLAFAHLVLAVAFIGPWQDPLRNRWVISFGLIACLGVLPLAWIAGPIRDIPVFWRLVDSSFGVLGSVPLWIVRARTRALEHLVEAP